jgi:hypothetical protein
MLEPLLPEEVEEREKILQRRAKELMPKILIPETDLLVVDRIGKNFSGDGMDPNITGTFTTPYASGGLKSQQVIVLGLSPETGGCAVGIGAADGTTKRVMDKFDAELTYPNCITAKVSETAKIPMVMKNDREAIALGIRMCTGLDRKNIRIIRIPNSLELGSIMVSENLMELAKNTEGMTVESEPFELPFDGNGNLF